MIEPLNAFVTNTTMPRSLSSYNLAIWTEQNWIKVFQHSLENLLFNFITKNDILSGFFKYPGSFKELIRNSMNVSPIIPLSTKNQVEQF
jgi:hypothetical protein